jgi:hypothetical protein
MADKTPAEQMRQEVKPKVPRLEKKAALFGGLLESCATDLHP